MATFNKLSHINQHPKRTSNAVANDMLDEEIDFLAAHTMALIAAGQRVPGDMDFLESDHE